MPPDTDFKTTRAPKVRHIDSFGPRPRVKGVRPLGFLLPLPVHGPSFPDVYQVPRVRVKSDDPGQDTDL